MKYFFMAFKNMLNYKGRARRNEYFYFFLFSFLFSFIIGFIIGIIEGIFPVTEIFMHNILLIYYIIILIANVPLCIRRIHDSNRSGWFIFAPFYNIYLMFVSGTHGENNYGHDPRK